MTRQTIISALICLTTSGWAAAQDTSVDMSGLQQDGSLPVEVASDSLEVDQADGTATFTGNVLVTQGDLKLAAGEVLVVYAEQDGAGTRIDELRASGGVTLVSGTEAAEARNAVYSLSSGSVVMTGDVVLTQGRTALSGDTLTLDLQTGTGRMEGRVRTVFNGGGN